MKLNINGQTMALPDDQTSDPLVWVLRDTLGLVGTRYGCGVGQCGACSILVNDQIQKSCQLTPTQVLSKKIVTLEGLSQNNKPSAVQQAFLENPLQCCWCVGGQVMAATALLSKNPNPNEVATNAAMQAQLCRCGGYTAIKSNVARAATLLRQDKP